MESAVDDSQASRTLKVNYRTCIKCCDERTACLANRSRMWTAIFEDRGHTMSVFNESIPMIQILDFQRCRDSTWREDVLKAQVESGVAAHEKSGLPSSSIRRRNCSRARRGSGTPMARPTACQLDAEMSLQHERPAQLDRRLRTWPRPESAYGRHGLRRRDRAALRLLDSKLW